MACIRGVFRQYFTPDNAGVLKVNIKTAVNSNEQFVNKSSFGLTGIVLRHIIRKIVFIGKAVYYDDQRPYIYQDQRT